MTEVDRPLPTGFAAIRVLGEGGFGEVVLARQLSLDRLVAVKRVHAYALGSADDLARFQREARVLASLDHPAVVRVLDFHLDEHSGAALIMEYVPGSTLADLLVAGPLAPLAAIRVLRDVAGALVAAATVGIVHRDIKSANVFVLPDGSAKLGDFGIARMLSDPAVFRTTDGSVRGTPGYMPPEAGLGGGEVDARSDAYAFAVLAFETLTGRLPFEGLEMAAALVAHWSAAPPAAASVVPGFPAAASAALAAGMAKDPADRPAPAALVDVLAAVPVDDWPAPGSTAGGAAVPGGAPVTTRTPAPVTIVRAPARVPELPAAPPRRRRRSVGSLAAVLVLLTVLALAGWRWWGPAGTPEPLAIEDVVLSLDPASGTGACPGATYRVTARVHTNGNAGPGSISYTWQLPDGRDTAPESVTVSAGQESVQLSLSFELTGTTAVTGPTVLQLTEPQVMELSSPPVAYSC